MKRSTFSTVFICFIALALLAVSGCGYGEYMRRSSHPTINATQTVTRYESTNYDVLGMVRAEGNSKCVLGIIIEGTEGEALLWDEAINKFGDRVTGIKDINSAYEYKSVLPPIFCEVLTTYVGTAVHEK